VDDEWATIGSSNLDPLSLSLNLEANVVIMHRPFNQQLRERLVDLMTSQCQAVPADRAAPTRHDWWRGAMGAVVFHFLRNFPNWAGLLPRHTIVLKKIDNQQEDTDAVADGVKT
jgi:cardiolipin synthase